MGGERRKGKGVGHKKEGNEGVRGATRERIRCVRRNREGRKISNISRRKQIGEVPQKISGLLAPKRAKEVGGSSGYRHGVDKKKPILS